jgi:hypothetical protein
LEAVKRHIAAIERGETHDDETGFHHAYHASCGLMYLAHFDRDPEQYSEFFDLPFARRDRVLASRGLPR